jgi:DNA repair protein RecO (recombination protein O)
MRSIKTTGIIIKRKNVGEADRIITMMTQEMGKIQVKAKGVRKITSKRSSHIELLNHGSFSLYKSGGMPILTEVDTYNTFNELKTDLSKVGLAYHICELVDSLCPDNQENESVFSLLYGLFTQLGNTKEAGRLIHEFEINLLQELGYYSGQDLAGSKASLFIETILERKLKARQILPHLL